MQNEYMPNDAAITIRIPASLKRNLEVRAKAQHRSLSAQVVADLEQILQETSSELRGKGRFLGLFEGTRLPSDQEIREVRDLVWGSKPTLGRHG